MGKTTPTNSIKPAAVDTSLIQNAHKQYRYSHLWGKTTPTNGIAIPMDKITPTNGITGQDHTHKQYSRQDHTHKQYSRQDHTHKQYRTSMRPTHPESICTLVFRQHQRCSECITCIDYQPCIYGVWHSPLIRSDSQVPINKGQQPGHKINKYPQALWHNAMQLLLS
jgi:hypothetical protein